MKKVLLGLLALSSVAMAEATPNNIYVKVGFDLGGNFTQLKEDGETFTKKEAKDARWELAVEETANVTSQMELGLGTALQFHGKVQGTEEYKEIVEERIANRFLSVPIYVVGKYNIATEGNYKPYVFANLGYSLNYGKTEVREEGYYINNVVSKVEMEHGAYIAGGIGVEKDNFVLELAYKLNEGKLKISGDGEETTKERFDYSRGSISIGYKF